MSPKVIYQDKNLLVLNKPAGLLIHPVRSSPPKGFGDSRHGGTGAASDGVHEPSQKRQELSLVSWLLKNYPEVQSVGDDPISRPGIVHRLDKDTSGVLVVARNQETFDYLKSLFQKHLVQKTYLALVHGKLKEKSGIINKPIGIKSGSTKRSIHSEKMKKEAITEYKFIKFLKLKDNEYSLLEVRPKTGRTHQIRVHLAAIGYPIVGDKLYGGKRPPADLSRQFLHAQSLEFTLPSLSGQGGEPFDAAHGERVKFEADLPAELTAFLKSAQ